MSTISALNESQASVFRYTKNGRKLTYELRVLQQPQRARACGSGAKSSADRRPVDPPPVIELKVYQGEEKTDITFNHKANFFVYTTLENARQMAQPRGQPINQPPVLTGSPVSGAALLDRPSPAAYFIFPDLSVRHEGSYRLSFNLFEELKDDEDDDVNPTPNPSHPAHGLLGTSPMAAQANVHFRLEVRSKPFTVYSAKKFPGLTESTSLSRVVAEQGCRVRIRRDVRMRRRDNKSSKDGHDMEDVSYAGYSEPASTEMYRQPSMEQLQHPSPQQPQSADHSYYPSPVYTPQYTSPAQAPAYMPHRPGSQQQYHRGIQSSPVEKPLNPAEVYSQYPVTTPHNRQTSLSSSSHDGSTHSSQHQSTYPQQSPQTPYNMPHRQQSDVYGQVGQQDPVGTGSKTVFWSEQQNAAQSVAIDNPYSMQQAAQPRIATAAELRAAAPSAAPLPPIKSVQPISVKSEVKLQSITPDPVRVHDIYDSLSENNSASVAAQVRAGSKRGYDRVFDAGRSVGISNGFRQDTSGQEVPQVTTDEGQVDMTDLLGMSTLFYRRANGQMQARRIASVGQP